MARPPGTSFLGTKPTTTMARIGEEVEDLTEIIVDTGSDITLISHRFWSSMKRPPKEKSGQKINLVQVTGKTSITGYVNVNLTFKTAQGPVKMPVEAYIVKGMKAPFILGNDFANQYRLTISRESDQGTRIVFGNTGRSVQAIESPTQPRTDDAGNVFRVLTVPDFKSNMERVAWRRRKYSKRKAIRLAPKGSTPVRLLYPIDLKPDTLTRVAVDAEFKEGQKEGFIERSLGSNGGKNDLHGITDCLISPESKSVQIANFSQEFVHLPKGHIVGYMTDPEDDLDKASAIDENLLKAGQAKINLINSLMKKNEDPPLTEEEIELSKPVEGGPKTSEVPDYEPIPSERLISELDISDELSKEEQKRIKDIVSKNSQAFGLDGRLGTYPARVEINLRPGTKEISMAPYTASPEKRAVIDKQVDEWLRLDVIEPSKSAWGFPVLVVYRNNKPRLCIDYRKLNAVVVPDEFPLPKQTDILHALGGAQYLTTLDALAGFTQLQVKEEDRPKTAFRCHRGLYQFKRMPFGYRNGPPIFQRVMQDILSPYLWIFALVYIDDIVIYSKTFDEHCEHLDTIFGAIADSGLTLSPSKCHLGYQSLMLLGQKVSRLGMSTHKEKVDAVLQIEDPKNVPTLQNFLGMMTYFSSYIPYYTWIVAPLFHLLKKNVHWTWAHLEKHAFRLAKQALANAPVLAYPMWGMPYRIYTDASDFGLAAILQQIQKITLKYLKGTKIYEKCHKAFDADLPVPKLFTPDSKSKDVLAGGASGDNIEFDFQTDWAENFDDTEVFVERPIAYWSRTLKPAESRYSATEREALALKEGLIKFQPYLEGTRFVAITDHAALTWSSTFQNINRRLLSYGTTYAAYPDMHIVHRAGRVHSNVDPISRLRRRIPRQNGPLADISKPLVLNADDEDPLSNLYQEIGDNFEKDVLVNAIAHQLANVGPYQQHDTVKSRYKVDFGKQEGVVNQVSSQLNSLIVSIDEREVDRFNQAYKQDPHFSKVLKALSEDHDFRNPPFKQYKIGDNGLIYFCRDDNYKLCVPKDLQKTITAEIHDSLPYSAHAGFHRTYNKVASIYYWPKMTRTIKHYVQTCDICQKAKPKRHGQRGFLKSIPIPSQPFEVITMDFIMDLPLSNGYNAILTIVDKLTKYTHFIPCNTTINEIETAKLFHDHIWMHYGLPRQVITDRDARWTGSFWEHLTSLVGIQRSLTTAYHPQADGQSEIMNQTLEVALRAFVSPELDDWSNLLPAFTFAYNNMEHTATGFAPSYLLRGFQPLTPSDLLAQTSQTLDRPSVENSNAESFAEGMTAVRTQAIDSLKVAQAFQEEYYNRGRSFMEFKEGDLVMINPDSLNLLRSSKGKGRKLRMKYDGPFEVLQKLSDVTYRLRMPASYKIHPVINIAHLEPYSKDADNADRPKRHLNRDDFDKRPEYEVEKIINERWIKKGKRRQKQYLTRFVDYPEEWDEWLFRQNLTNAPMVLKEWELERSKLKG